MKEKIKIFLKNIEIKIADKLENSKSLPALRFILSFFVFALGLFLLASLPCAAGLMFLLGILMCLTVVFAPFGLMVFPIGGVVLVAGGTTALVLMRIGKKGMKGSINKN